MNVYLSSLLLLATGVGAVDAPAPVNLLLNPAFGYHSFANSRTGQAASFRSGAVAGWNQDAYGDAEVYRAPRVSAFRPRFPVENVVVIHPGKRFHQFSLLAETGLDHGDHVSLSVFGHQPAPQLLQVSLHLMRLDSASGEWSPAQYGQRDTRTFPRHARGELVKGTTSTAASGAENDFEVRIENTEITGAFTESPDRSTDQPNTIGLLVEFVNRSRDQDVWIYAPCLCRGPAALSRLPEGRALPALYRGIPRTIQKLWRGEPLHIMVMGSSIDRGSANPPQYLYDEDPRSPTFKQPLAGGDFDGEKVGHPEWNDYVAWWQHYFMYGGRLRRLLMEKFDYPVEKLLLNTMAVDGSSISEAHSGFAEYASLSLPPDPGGNGHRAGKTWQQLYPALFARPEGPRPDLVIFGSGANEHVDGADETALFEGAIRWFQRHYPDTEFLFCMWQNRESYTPNTGHLMELALRYQIPYIDLGRIVNLTTRYCNSYALVPRDGHPQAAAHYLWAKQLERAFDVADPIQPGVAQLQLPERANPYTVGWEGEIATYGGSDPRLHGGTAFILDDTVINLWATTQDAEVVIRMDGQTDRGSRRRPMAKRDVRNSTFATGALALGDRHVVEVTGKEARLVAVDAKSVPGRQWIGVESPRWQLAALRPEPFASQWGAPYGTRQVRIPAGRSVTIELPGTDFSLAYLDQAAGGTLRVAIDGRDTLRQPANVAFTDAGGNPLYMENRRGIRGLPYGLHAIRVTADGGPVALLGIFSYDTRPNRAAERVERGIAHPGETVRFTSPFKARPLVFCTGGLQALSVDITATGVKFSGKGTGGYEIVGE
jgi:hypothetical protein